MRMALIKEYWDFEDEDLFFADKLTDKGKSALWRAIDSSLKFNISKRERIAGRQKTPNQDSNKFGNNYSRNYNVARGGRTPSFFVKRQRMSNNSWTGEDRRMKLPQLKF